MAFVNARNNVVHELGHALGQQWYRKDGSYDPAGPYANIPSDPDTLGNEGYYPSPVSASLTWRQHPCTPQDCTGNEAFADMFLGWTYDRWEDSDIGDWRDFFMTSNMDEWLR
jgi:hypothetical protein